MSRMAPGTWVLMNWLAAAILRAEGRSSGSFLAKLLREFDKAGIETELFEEHRYTPAPWQSEPMSREFFHNILQRNREIERETMLGIEREVEGFVSPEAMADIEEELRNQDEEY